MKKTKEKTYLVYTTCLTGWIYEVKAKSKKSAENKMYAGEYFNERENQDWEGDSGEEIYSVEEKKKGNK
jgi:hypothetical protein